MKNNSLKIFSCIFIVVACCFTAKATGHSQPILQKDPEPEIKIIYSEKTLEFSLTKDDKINAVLSVKASVLPLRKSAVYEQALFFGSNSEVKTIRADRRRITPIVSDYESSGIFHHDSKIVLFKHTLNDVEKPVEISYSKVYYDYKFIDLIYFLHNSYPVDKCKIIVKIPDWLECKLAEFNFDEGQITKKQTQEDGQKILTFTATEIPVPPNEKGAPAPGKIYPHIMVIPQFATIDGKKEPLLSSVKDLYAWYSMLASDVDNNVNPLKAKVAELTKGVTSEQEKIKAIYYWVQDNIRYIAFEHGIMGFKPEACQDVYNNKYGDCKGMANLTKEMLKIAGFDARLTWVGTRDVPYTYDHPTLYADNHMICTVILDEDKIFLDPTEKYCDLYNYANRIQGQQVLIENQQDFFLENIPELDAAHNEQNTNSTISIEGTNLKGHAVVSYSGNSKTSFFNRWAAVSLDDKKDWLKHWLSNGNKNIKIILDEMPDVSDRDKNAVIDFQFEANNFIIDLGNEVYLNPDLDRSFSHMEINDDRELPYEFHSKYFINHTSRVKIPGNWTSTYIPEAVNISNNDFSFQLKYTLKGNEVHYTKVIKLNDLLLDKIDFESWNKAIETLNTFYDDQLIFNKS